MADRFGVHIVGLSEFRRALRAMGPQWGIALRTAHAAIAELVATRARELAPTLKTRPGTTSMAPGQLRDSIRGLGSQRSARIRAGGASLPHPSIPAIHEFGWPGHNIEPQPYMYRAEEESREQAVDEFADMIDAISRAAFPS